jgi:DNA-binding transcriptional regulator YbjK
MRMRLWPDRRLEIIAVAAARVLKQRGENGLTLDAVSRECEVPTSVSLIKHYVKGGRPALIATARKHARRSKQCRG